MLRQSIWLGLLILLMAAPLSIDNNPKEGMQKDVKDNVITKDYCNMEDLGEMDYYLFCHTEMSGDVGPVEYVPIVLSSQTQTLKEAEDLYQEFKKRLPLEDDSDEDGRTEVFYISPDCKWVITNKWSKFQTISTQMLFYEKENIKKVVEESGVMHPILIVKDGDTYREMEEEHYKKLSELKSESILHENYFPIWEINADGNLLAGTRDNFSMITIREIEDGEEQWSFSLQGIQEEARKIRGNMGYEEDFLHGIYTCICQFEGNEQEGWIIVQAGTSSFFRITYPSGEVTYLGEYLYSPCFSPDGKYVAYSGIDYDNVVAMDLEEEEQIPPPGIYVKEIETGKTAYIYWNRLPEERTFMWLEKEEFEEFMGENNEK